MARSLPHIDRGRSTVIPEQERVKERTATELGRGRRRSNGLTLDALDDDGLQAQHSPLLSPLIWDLAHTGNYERSEEHTSELQSRSDVVRRVLLENKNKHQSTLPHSRPRTRHQTKA